MDFARYLSLTVSPNSRGDEQRFNYAIVICSMCLIVRTCRQRYFTPSISL